MKSRLEKVLDKMPNKKVDLKAQKVALGLIDQLQYDYDSIEDQGGLLSYLAYEWHEEKMIEAQNAWMTLNDEYKFNASAVFRFEDVEADVNVLNEIRTRAEELGVDVNDVYPNYEDHLQRLEEMREADAQYQENEREFYTYFGN